MVNVNFQARGVIITAKQKSQIEKKVAKLKKYLNADPVNIDILLTDETSPEKGGMDQTVKLSVTFGKEKIIIEETDDRLMRAFSYAFDRLERNLCRLHQRKVESQKEIGGLRFDKVLGIIKRKK